MAPATAMLMASTSARSAGDSDAVLRRSLTSSERQTSSKWAWMARAIGLTLPSHGKPDAALIFYGYRTKINGAEPAI